jgi:Uma2 family endonuclease
VDGVLVEKVMGHAESYLAMWLGHLVQTFLDENDLGFVAGESAATRLLPGLVRIPDVSFISWDRLPSREVPTDPIAGLAPDLAVEVLSRGNTRAEMQRKLKEYFLAGVRLVWFVDPARRAVQVFTSPDDSATLMEGQSLGGGDLLPGLSVPLRKLFARLPRKKSAPPRKSRKHGARGA